MGDFFQIIKDNPFTFGLIVFFVIILIILITIKLTSVPVPVPVPVPASVPILKNHCELFSGCNFKTMTREDRKKYPNIINNYVEAKDNTNEFKIDNILIKSIKSNGVFLTLYSNPDFTGEKMSMSPSIINIECLEKPMRSAIITPNIT
jgi:hypothetical protein